MSIDMKKALVKTALTVVGACGLAVLAPQSALAKNDCVAHAAEAERELGIPAGILASIAMVESGGDGTPNPYIMNVNGRALVAKSAGDVARRLVDKKGRVASSAYVGCMQISLRAHRAQFGSVSEIADPRENVRYAGRLLLRLHGEEGNWRSAIARYNGAPIRSAQGYVCKVWRYLNEFDSASARLIESNRCEEVAASISPRTRSSYKNAQVVEIN
jgi:hypothetical protein